MIGLNFLESDQLAKESSFGNHFPFGDNSATKHGSDDNVQASGLTNIQEQQLKRYAVLGAIGFAIFFVVKKYV